jgi:tetratricopeptide repeat protein 30
MKSLEPYPKKLGTDTWFYAKRAFLALAETLAKHMIMLKDVRMRRALRTSQPTDVHSHATPSLAPTGALPCSFVPAT